MIRRLFYLVFCVVLLTSLVAIPAQAASEEDIEASVEAGLAWLVAQQNMNPLDLNYGSWVGYYSREAGTGLALYKLCDRAYELGYESPFDPEYEYSGNVSAGFTWLFKHLLIVPIISQNHTAGASGMIDNPDTRVNGKGVCAAGQGTYGTGILLAAIAASGTPGRTNEGGLDVDGDGNADTYQEIAQDMVDFLAFGQVEYYPVDPALWEEGGWDYSAVNNGVGGTGWHGDQSNSGYAVLGLAEAEAFGCVVPQWVKTELNWWIDAVQDDVNGGSWYSYPTGDWVGQNILKTGNLILEMKFFGDTPDTPRVVNALAYLSSNWTNPAGPFTANNGWKSANPGVLASDYQTMFCIMKGLEYMGITTFGDPAIDWFEEFSDAIVDEQDNATGGWLLLGNWTGSESVINTEWALLTLEKVAPPPTPIEVEKGYTYTDVRFERDNDNDGKFNEDPVDGIDNDQDGKVDEDPVDYPEGTFLGTPLPTDPAGNFLIEAVVTKNGIVSSYNPGQYYAVSTVNVLVDVDMLTIEEDFRDCVTSNISALNPEAGGGAVVVVQVGPEGEVAYQILDAKSPQVSISGNVATVKLGAVKGGTTILVYVKFSPGLKGKTWPGGQLSCENTNSAWVVEEPEEDDIISATATLILSKK